jgi:shikimate kinase
MEAPPELGAAGGAPRLNVVLIGMPGVGKSTVGVLLAKRLGYAFIDTDLTLQVRERASLQALIAARGAKGFLALEEAHILALALEGHVIAPGGSVVYSERAMAHLRAGGLAVHLDIGLDLLERRLDDPAGRGVVIAPGQTIAHLYRERRPLYRRFADREVATDGLAPAEVVEAVLRVIPPSASPGR